MKPTSVTDVLFYPFHLCHARTLQQLLKQCERVHFRDYMAIQLSPFFGTTAYPDRMGDTYPDLLAQGRLVQGYDVSGPLSHKTIEAVNRDLTDQTWRHLFHRALTEDRRFRGGLFGTTAEEALIARLTAEPFRTDPMTVADIQRLCDRRTAGNERDRCDYGFALLKTSAALVYTVQLAEEYQLTVATDSPAHGALLNRLAERDGVKLRRWIIERIGY